MYTCKICGQEFNNNTRKINSTNLINHLRKHKIRSKEDLKKYYDEFIKKENEEICILDGCNKICKFKNLFIGYAETCSHSHQTTIQLKRFNHLIGRPPSKIVIERSKLAKKERDLERKKILEEGQIVIDNALNGIFNFDDNLDVLKTCVFCGFEFKGITGVGSVCFHVLKKHGIDKNVYKNLFLYKRRNFKNYCVNCGREISSENKENVCNKCLSFCGKLRWNNYSKDEKKSLSMRRGAGNKGKKHPHTQATKDKISKNSQYNDPLRSSILKENQSKIMTDKILNHEFNPHASYKNGYLTLKKCKEEIFYRSSIEKIILENIDELDWVDNIEYEPFKCEYIVTEKGVTYSRYTIPDLLLKKDENTFISEIKPFEFIETPIGCWDKFLIEKIKSIIKYSIENSLNSPSILTIKDGTIYKIDMIQYIEEIYDYGCVTVEELFVKNSENKKYKISGN